MEKVGFIESAAGDIVITHAVYFSFNRSVKFCSSKGLKVAFSAPNIYNFTFVIVNCICFCFCCRIIRPSLKWDIFAKFQLTDDTMFYLTVLVLLAFLQNKYQCCSVQCSQTTINKSEVKGSVSIWSTFTNAFKAT